jgi:hypothetical protein
VTPADSTAYPGIQPLLHHWANIPLWVKYLLFAGLVYIPLFTAALFRLVLEKGPAVFRNHPLLFAMILIWLTVGAFMTNGTWMLVGAMLGMLEAALLFGSSAILISSFIAGQQLRTRGRSAAFAVLYLLLGALFSFVPHPYGAVAFVVLMAANSWKDLSERDRMYSKVPLMRLVYGWKPMLYYLAFVEIVLAPYVTEGGTYGPVITGVTVICVIVGYKNPKPEITL